MTKELAYKIWESEKAALEATKRDIMVAREHGDSTEYLERVAAAKEAELKKLAEIIWS